MMYNQHDLCAQPFYHGLNAKKTCQISNKLAQMSVISQKRPAKFFTAVFAKVFPLCNAMIRCCTDEIWLLYKKLLLLITKYENMSEAMPNVT